MQFTLLGLWLWSGFSFLTVSNFYSNNKFFSATGTFLGYILRLSKDNITTKFAAFFRNKAALVLVSLFILHIIGLIHTTDFSYAFKDLRTKLPLLAFPVILSTMEPLSRKRFNYIILFHAAAVLVGTFFSTYELFKGEFTDIRKISIFISPIRFSLNICIALFSLIYFSFISKAFPAYLKLIFFAVIIWMVAFLVILESGIGIIIFLTIGVILLLALLFKITNLYLRFGLLLFIVGVPLILFFYVKGIVNEFNDVEPADFSKLETHTQAGNPYRHDTVWLGIEDGKHVGLYMQWQELEKAWNERSSYNFHGKDQNGQDIRFTIIRYMASKGLRKDSVGVYSLDTEDINAIERGIANVNYLENPSIKTRISKIMIGYHNFKYEHDPNGSSVLQRIEFWKASVGLIKQHFWFGVGTGDVNNEFNNYYEETNSQLKISNRWRSHNQYLSAFVAFGVFGFLWFLFTLLYPPFKERKFSDYFYVVFFITITMSMLTEDTIESQAGVTLFAFFNSFLLFCRKK